MFRFSLGDVPVGVHASFLVIAFFGPGRSVSDIVMWTGAIFVAVLAHEAGHAFTARAYGARPVEIRLVVFGGVTTYPANAVLSPGRRFVIAAAGSLVGIVLGGAVALVRQSPVFAFPRAGTAPITLFADTFVLAALGWGILNWVPIRPLDGGQMLTSGLQILSPTRGASIARVISAVSGVAVAIVALKFGLTILAIFVMFITVAGLRRAPDDAPAPSAPSDGPDPPGPPRRLSPGDPDPTAPGDDEQGEGGGPPPSFPI